MLKYASAVRVKKKTYTGSWRFHFFKTVPHTHILNLFHLMKSFKHEHIFYLHLYSYMSSEHTFNCTDNPIKLDYSAVYLAS